jgi:PBP1b-binding outer membrane lipoprotein LpoB
MKKIHIYLISILIAMAFQGCLSTTNLTYIEYKNVPVKQKAAEQIVVKQEEIPKEVSGIIKGRVTKLSYNAAEGLWDYSVESKDTSNGKLSSAKFTHKSNIAKKGDLVYAFISDGALKEFYLMEKAKYISAKKHIPIQKQEVVSQKRNKRYATPVEVPSSELILLN